MRESYFQARPNNVIKGKIDGLDYIFYANNLNNAELPLLKYGSIQVTTKQTRSHFSTAIKLISDLAEGIAVFDERAEKYATALSVLNAINAVLNNQNASPPSIEAAKIAIDVVKEVSLLEVKDEFQRTAIKSVALIAKLFLGKVGDDK